MKNAALTFAGVVRLSRCVGLSLTQQAFNIILKGKDEDGTLNKLSIREPAAVEVRQTEKLFVSLPSRRSEPLRGRSLP